jgi:hypothetical protein
LAEQAPNSVLTHVVESIEDNVKGLKVVDVETRLLDVAMDGLDLDVRVEVLRRLLGHECLGAFDVLFAEEELAVQVGQVNGVEVDLDGFAQELAA